MCSVAISASIRSACRSSRSRCSPAACMPTRAVGLVGAHVLDAHAHARAGRPAPATCRGPPRGSGGARCSRRARSGRSARPPRSSAASARSARCAGIHPGWLELSYEQQNKPQALEVKRCREIRCTRPNREASTHNQLLAARIRSVYSPGYERSPDPARPARARAEPRLRPQARLRRLLRPRQAAAVRPGLRHARPAGPRRQGGGRRGRARARARTASATSSPSRARPRSRPGWPSRSSPSRTCRPCCSPRSCWR